MALRNNFVLPPPPNPDEDINGYSWRDWFRQLRDYIVNKGTILWSQIDFTGSNITDILTRRHNDLQVIQGGASNQYYHLTSPEYTGTGSGVFVRKTNPTLESPNTDNVDFSTSSGSPTYAEGRVFYDNVNKALAYYNDASDVTVQVGQENIVRVYNNTGSTILNGQVCYINGASGAFPTVALAKADSSTTSQATLGICTADIDTGGYGYITTDGIVHDINTNGMTAGATVYLSAATAGAYTTTAPLQPSYAIVVGYVTEVSATTGAIYVQIDRLPWFPNGEIRLTAASTALPTTPTIFTSPSVVTEQGMSYDNATGVLTINVSGSYALSHTFNCSPSAANKKVYFYVEESTDGGSTWVIARYSARQLELINGTETQLTIVGSRYYAMGTKIRYYLWGDATVTLKTTDLPGTTAGTVTLPAYRLTLAG
jgi:hypothetical protein